MQRLNLTFVLISAVLICPYLCLGEAVGSGSAPCSSGCCSCAGEEKQPVCSTPESPADDEAPEDYDPGCFCHGAIMDSASPAVRFNLLPSLAFCGQIDDAALSSRVSSSAKLSFESPHPFPLFSSGWDVCVLKCALLL